MRLCRLYFASPLLSLLSTDAFLQQSCNPVGFATNLNKNANTQIDKRQLSGRTKARVLNAFKNPFEAFFERQSTETTAQINPVTKNVVEEYFAGE